jgi:hypothetical protein
MEASDGAMGQKWTDVLAGVATLADLLQTCQDAFGEDDAAPKVCLGAAAAALASPVIADAIR